MADTQKSSAQNEISTYLEYAHLQIAAEAFIGETRGRTFQVKSKDEISKRASDKLIDDLIEGNWHSSKFSKTLADEFVKRWKVVRHIGMAIPVQDFQGHYLKPLKTIRQQESIKANKYCHFAAPNL